MSSRPWSAGTTRLFSSNEEDDSSSDTSNELWAHSAVGVRGGGGINNVAGGGSSGYGAESFPGSATALKTALRASRTRASAAVAKASR